jgi:hypothetical protein
MIAMRRAAASQQRSFVIVSICYRRILSQFNRLGDGWFKARRPRLTQWRPAPMMGGKNERGA